MLHYRTIANNQSGSWVVMIHGAGGSIEVWHRQVADFARHYNILLVDLVGHGGSAQESFGKSFNFSKAADQVMEVVDHLKIEKGHFMGLSLGSIVVRTIAKQHPHRVESMVLAGAVTRLSRKTRRLFRLLTRFKKIIPYRLLKRFIAHNMIPQREFQESKKLYLKSAKMLSFDSFLKWMKVAEELHTRIKALFNEYISIPTLYLMGEDDKLFLPEVQQTVKNGGDNVSLIIVPKAGHVCNVDNKSFFNQESLNFLCSI
ncbi:MAG: alpha/beta hydrolase [Tidjanibacter sp.]|nr:alpha/beta hydrolase [Tidjanibacter sp.]